MVETIQSRIMDAYYDSLIGQNMQILVDGYDEETEQYFGRTYADSPEIDGKVWIASEEALSEGSFVTVHIDAIVDGDPAGYVVEEDV
jgi:ribosomal protein S12 methylthiotransferase